MKNIVVTVATLLFGAGASACPMWASVSQQYGIGAGGMMSPLPRAEHLAGGPFTTIELPESSLVSDGFRHTLLIDKAARKIWIRRSGGYAGVSELYGPLDVGGHALDGCESSTGRVAGASRSLAPGSIVVSETGARAKTATPDAPGTL